MMAALGERAKSGGVLARSPAGPGPVLARPDSVAVGVLGLPCRRATAARDMTTAGWGWAGWTAFHHPSRVGRTEGGISLVRASARTEGATGSYVHGKRSNCDRALYRPKAEFFIALERESPQGTRRSTAERGAFVDQLCKIRQCKDRDRRDDERSWKSGGGDTGGKDEDEQNRSPGGIVRQDNEKTRAREARESWSWIRKRGFYALERESRRGSCPSTAGRGEFVRPPPSPA